MEAGENHVSKRSRVGGTPAAKIGSRHQYTAEPDGGDGGLRQWNHPASRIYRVSRASGGKDRHSKVYTSKGLRDRRVRLSVSTAIQFYDLQDRLGYDQPSKAIAWLINAAAAAIAELPTLESSFPEPLKEEKLDMMVEHEVEPGDSSQHQQQHFSLSKSGCSSTSETSKGSVLSLSRSEIRVKARERARSRVAKDKDTDDGQAPAAAHHNTVSHNLNLQSSFTELLTGGGGSNGAAVTVAQMGSGTNSMQKQSHYLPITATADYFAQASLFGQPQKAHQPMPSSTSGFTTQAHLGNSSPMMPFNIAAAAAAAAPDDHPEMHQFSFLQDHPGPLAAVTAGDYNLNFSISSGLAGFNRGTLQSNSPSHHHHHLQRLSSHVDGSNLPFFFGAASPAAAATSADNQFPGGFEGRLQLSYGDGYRLLNLKGKEKS